VTPASNGPFSFRGATFFTPHTDESKNFRNIVSPGIEKDLERKAVNLLKKGAAKKLTRLEVFDTPIANELMPFFLKLKAAFFEDLKSTYTAHPTLFDFDIFYF